MGVLDWVIILSVAVLLVLALRVYRKNGSCACAGSCEGCRAGAACAGSCEGCKAGTACAGRKRGSLRNSTGLEKNEKGI